MTRRILIECGAAETRAAILDGDEFTHFWFGPARGDEGLPRPPQSGDIFTGRVRKFSKALNGAFIDIGAARDGFLPISKGAPEPVEGAMVIVMARRPPVAAKGAVLTLDWEKGLDAGAIAKIETQAKSKSAGPVGEIPDAALWAVRQYARITKEIDVAADDPAAISVLEKHGVVARFEAAPELDDAITQSLEQTVMLPQGALLHFHETRAGALLDVDSASAAAGATGVLNDKINLTVASHLPGEISRRAIAGRVVIDFLPPSGADARARLAAAVCAGIAAVPRARFGKLAKDGLCDLTVPREQCSLLESATEFSGTDWPVDGRRFTLDWSAKRAIRSLEKALRAQLSARVRLLVGADINEYLVKMRPQWSQRLIQKYGARLIVELEASMEARHHDIA